MPAEDPAFEPPLRGVAYPGAGSSAPGTPPTDPAHAATTVMQTPGSPPSNAAPSGNKNGLLAMVLAVGAVALIGVIAVGGWFFTRGDGSGETATGLVPADSTAAVGADTDVDVATTDTDESPLLVDPSDLRLEVDGPRVAMVGEPVTFTARFDAENGVDAQFDWAFDSEARSGQIVTYAWDAPGMKRVSATMTASTGGSGLATSSQQFDVVVTEEPETDVTAITDDSAVADAVAGGEATNGILADFSWEPAVPAPGQSIELIDTSNIETQTKTWRWLKSTISASGTLKVSLRQPTEVTLEVCRDQARTDCDSVTKLVPVS